MRFQTILLSLVILTSLLINKNYSSPGGKTNEPSFMKEFYFALSEKTVSIKQILPEGTAAVRQRINDGTKQVSGGDESKETENKKTEKENPGSAEIRNNPDFNLNSSSFQCNSTTSISFKAEAVLAKKINIAVPNEVNGNIFEFNVKKRWPIASLTKLMTSAIVLEKIGLNERVIMSEKAVNSEGETGDFKKGEIFTASDLIKAMLTVSSNDAAAAVAESSARFVDQMQQKAAELKMYQTTFFEPTGLSFINQSTAFDLVKLTDYVYQNHPELIEISGQKETEIVELKSGKPRKLININEFAGSPGFIGGKTGYIEEAGRNLVAIFDANGGKILIVVLGADNAYEEAKKLLKCTSLTFF